MKKNNIQTSGRPRIFIFFVAVFALIGVLLLVATRAEINNQATNLQAYQRFPGDPNPLVTGKAYWGAAINGNGDPSRHEDPTNRSLSIRRTYWDMRTTSKINSSVNSAKNDIDNNRLPFISYKLKNDWTRTAQGADQAAVDDLLRRLDNLGGPVWLAMHHEPEGGGGTRGPGPKGEDDASGAAGWVEMQRYIRSRMNAVGTKNIAFVANLMTWTWDSRSGRDPAQWVPSDSKNIWDVYTANSYCDNESKCKDGGETAIDTAMWKNFESNMNNINIPYGTGEWGDRGESLAAGADIKTVWDHGFENNKDIVAWTYFDSNLNSPNGGWELKGEALKTFQSILRDDQRVMRINELNSGSQTTGNFGTITSTVDVPTNGTYKVWARMSTPDSNNNAVQVQIDDGSIAKLGDAAIPANTWTWIDYKNGDKNNKATYDLSAGSHEIKLTGIESSVKIDRIILTDETCQPTDTGENCATPIPPATPPPPSNAEIDITSPTNGSTLKGSVIVAATPSTNIQEVSFRVDGKWQATDKDADFNWTWDTTKFSDGKHTLTIRARKIGDPGNVYTEKNINVSVANQPSTPPVAPKPVDTEKPSRPTSLQASLSLDWTKFSYATQLKWQPSTDNVEVAEYIVQRNGEDIGTSVQPGFADANIVNGVTYTYSVQARDAANNISSPSSLTVKGNCFLIWCSLEVL